MKIRDSFSAFRANSKEKEAKACEMLLCIIIKTCVTEVPVMGNAVESPNSFTSIKISSSCGNHLNIL